jgi:putative transposase
MSAEHSITVLCQTLGISRSGYYDWTKAKSVREASDKTLLLEIKQILERSLSNVWKPVYNKRFTRSWDTGHNRVARLMREVGIIGRTKRRYRVRTTDSNHDQPIAPNLLRDMPLPERPNQVWVSDITYIPTHEGWLYLAGVLDRYSRKLVGWSMDSTLHTRLPLSALKMAIDRRRPEPGLIHHSDRGIQYTSQDYRNQLDENGMIASMSRKGNCYDNAAMESFWSTLKHELIFRCTFRTRDEAKAAIFDYIEGFYNRKRSHSSLGYKSPLDYELNLSYPNN